VVTDPRLERVVSPLAAVPGVVVVALGGSRASGTAVATPDHDLGLARGLLAAVG
jgi:hypothetical protein